MSLTKMHSPLIKSCRNPNPLGGLVPDPGSSAKTWIFTLKPSSSLTSCTRGTTSAEKGGQGGGEGCVCVCCVWGGGFNVHIKWIEGWEGGGERRNGGNPISTFAHLTYLSRDVLKHDNVIRMQSNVPHAHMPSQVIELLGIEIDLWHEV